MPETGKDHGHAMLITEINGILVLYGASRLDNAPYTSLVSDLHAIRKREKRVRSHNDAI